MLVGPKPERKIQKRARTAEATVTKGLTLAPPDRSRSIAPILNGSGSLSSFRIWLQARRKRSSKKRSTLTHQGPLTRVPRQAVSCTPLRRFKAMGGKAEEA